MHKIGWGAFGRSVARGLILFSAGVIASCSPFGDDKLASVKNAGELVVLTRNSPTTFYEGPDGPTGIEYDLAKAFADHLGVRLKIIVVSRFGDIIPMIARGDADLAAAGLTVTPLRQKQVRFAPPYQSIRQQLVYRAGTRAPADVSGLVGRHVEVVAGSSYAERLNELKLLHPELSWSTADDVETEELLLQVQEGLLEITIADSNIVSISRQFYPELQIAFDIQEAEKLAWAFPRSDDDSLYREAISFIKHLHKSGQLAQLIERYYGAASRFNPINIAAYLQGIETRLPFYQPLFEAAGKANGLDWRLLAAMAYQESYWNPSAVSPTGVRGIMMLTQATAEHLGIEDRLDPEQSISGGARYVRSLIERLPGRIEEPDRTWMALAAYNVGIHHLEDARIITQNQGGDPAKWNDVKQHLPLLAKYSWYSKTRYGYARGYEPVQFVTRIRTYYDVLRKTDDDQKARQDSDALKLKIPAI